MKNSNIQQYIGKKRNHWTILGTVEPKMSPTTRRQAIVKCDCGNETVYYKDWNSVISGISKSCGCERVNSNKSRSGNNNTKIQASLQKYVGKVYPTNEGYHVEVVSLRNTHDVTVRFQEVDYEISSATMQNVTNGQLKYPYKENSYGGVYGDGQYKARENGKKTVAYNKWIGIFDRLKNVSCYDDCSIVSEWYDFQNFAKWFYQNYYQLENERLCVDKDIIDPFARTYGPNTCVLIPQSLNSCFIKPRFIPIQKEEVYEAKCYDPESHIFKKMEFNSLDEAKNTYIKNLHVWLHNNRIYFLEILKKYESVIPKDTYQKLEFAIENY